MITWKSKDPDEVVSNSLDWSPVLQGDEIATSTLEVVSGSAVIDADSFDSSTISATIAGGTADETTTFRNTITTVGGFIYEETISVAVVSSDYPLGPSTTRKRAIIEMALEEIGLSPNEFDASPQEYVSALRRLDALMREWKPQFDLGYNFPSVFGGGEVDDPSGILDEDLHVVALALGLRLAPMVGKTVSPEFRTAYAQAMVAFRARYAVLPTVTIPTGYPLGAGRGFSTGA